MDPGDALATIAESQIGTRADLWPDRASLYGYLMATDSSLVDFGTHEKGKPMRLLWERQGFGTSTALHRPRRIALMSELYPDPGPPFLLRFHNWCAAFVDWCVQQLLLQHQDLTTISYAHRPRTAAAVGLLDWGRKRACTVLEGDSLSPRRGDIAVYTFHTKDRDQHHVGIVSRVEAKSAHLWTVEGNTSEFGYGNQGYAVAKRSRETSQLKGLVRLPARS